MARLSRPPGFDMTYRPVESRAFGPPVRARVPSLIYLGLAVILVLVVIAGSISGSGTWLFRYIVELDSTHAGARPLAAIVLASAIAAVVRARMRGVVVHPEGLEARDVLGVGWPRIRRYAWPQIDKIVLDAGQTIAVDLWDGRREWLPKVGESAELAAALERIAMARAIPISGGTGMIRST